ncbi:hypothetical protein EC988_007781, partial [Linderina pennispora]
MGDSAEDIEKVREEYRRRRRELDAEEKEDDLGLNLDDLLGPEDEPEEYIPVKQRRLEKIEGIRKRLQYSEPQDEGRGSDNEAGHSDSNENDTPSGMLGPQAGVSLVDQIADLRRKHLIDDKTEEEKQREQEKALLEAIARKKQLASAAEIAKGVVYSESMKSTWRPLARHRALTQEEVLERRKLYHIIVDGEDIPPPLFTFKAMRFPQPILDYLVAKGITEPSTIQMQGLPVALSGRDMIGIASTGTGKTLAFSLPLIMLALQEECRMGLVKGEGPIGLIVCPSRELARQTYEGLLAMSEALVKGGFPELRAVLAIGGISMQDQ